MNRILVIGATSAIAQEAVRLFAQDGRALFLVGRTPEKLAVVADDLRVRGAERVSTFELDVNDVERHANMLEEAEAFLGGLDGVLIAHGSLPDQQACEAHTEAALEALRTNCISVVALLTPLANLFEAQGHGCIAVISSVAGDRGRQSNYVYGSAKAAVSTFLQGLRNRLSGSGVSVVTIKPGLVDTPMTAALRKNALYTTPERVGRRIYSAMIEGEDVVFVPGFWRWVMLGIRSVPEGVFKKMSL